LLAINPEWSNRTGADIIAQKELIKKIEADLKALKKLVPKYVTKLNKARVSNHLPASHFKAKP
jgi:hypothetical protein